MFTNITDATNYVMARRKSNHPFSAYKDYLAQKGNPQLQLKTIHVAGTNGKGSTTNYLRSIFQNTGYKVGSFTSPHLMTHLDRIRINDENISADFFLDTVNKYQKEWEDYDLTMFEIDMFISILYFLEEKVDIVIYEVGLGGRLDATNVIMPMGAVITNIEMDHMEILGDTIGKIAFEKAGIIKEGIPVVTFEKKKEALDVFYKVAKEKNAHLYVTDYPTDIELNDHVSFKYLNSKYDLPTLALYQPLNATAAIELIHILNQQGKTNISEETIRKGLNTMWLGRFEKVKDNPLVIIDGAHNENGIDMLCKSIDYLNKDCIIVFSALKDKNYHQMLGKLIEKGKVIVTEFDNYRKQSADKLAEGFDEVMVISDYKSAIETALSYGKTVIITGSLYFISIVREYFKSID